jgi:hypothetical protein
MPPITPGDPRFGETTQTFDGEANVANIIKANNQRRVYLQNGLPWPPGYTPQPPLPPDPEPGEEPVLNSINPSSARIGSADVEMNVNGNKFTETSIIYFNGGIEPTTFISSDQLRTTVKPSTAEVAGSFPVWVQQGSYQTDQKTFTFLPENEEEPTNGQPAE